MIDTQQRDRAPISNAAWLIDEAHPNRELAEEVLEVLDRRRKRTDLRDRIRRRTENEREEEQQQEEALILWCMGTTTGW